MNNKIIVFLFVLIVTGSLYSCRQDNSTVLPEKDIVLTTIHNRTSVRSFIKERPVSEEDIDALVRVGMAAPSGKDIRPWEIVVIDDREILYALAGELNTAKMLADAPMAIIVCGDTLQSFYWYLDCSAAAQNILLASEALGLGAVWTASYPYRDRMEVVKKYIDMPPHVLPLNVIPIGHSKGNHSPKDKYNKDKVHRNKW